MTTTTPTTPTTIDLPWDKEDEHPRRLCQMPCGSILAYGSTNAAGASVLYRVVCEDNNDNHNHNNSSSSCSYQEIRSWEDDEIRALAVSPDGRRVVVGLDSGGLQVYAYDNYDTNWNEDNNSNSNNNNMNNLSTMMIHPFAKPPTNDEITFAGPYMDAQVRDLAFYPLSNADNNNDNSSSSNSSNSYWLAVATEAGLCILSATSPQTIAASVHQNHGFQQQVALHHDESGIRAVTFWKPLDDKNTNTDAKKGVVLLSTLAMDGRHCVWDCTGGSSSSSSSSTDPNTWKLLTRETTLCITKKDVGEVLGADAWDRSCRPAIVTTTNSSSSSSSRHSNILALPGEPFLQWRFLDENNSNAPMTAAATTTTTTTTTTGQQKQQHNHDYHHNQTIVVVATALDHPNHVVTSGRDGRVVLWRVQKNNDIKNGETIQAHFVQQIAELETPATDLLFTQGNNNNNNDCSLYIPTAKGDLFVYRNVLSTDAAATAKAETTTSSPAVAVPEKDDDEDASVSSSSSSAHQKSASPPRLPKATDKVEDNDDDDEEEFDATTAKETTQPASSPQRLQKLSKVSADDRVNNDDDDDDDDDIDFSQHNTSPQKNQFVDDEAADDDDDHDDDDDGSPQKKKHSKSNNDDDDDANRSSNSSILPEEPPQRTVHFGNDDDDDSVRDDDTDVLMAEQDQLLYEQQQQQHQRGMNMTTTTTAATMAVAYRPPESQAAFAPSSTPLDLDRRFLCWNHVGSVTLFRGGGGGSGSSSSSNALNTVDIQFTAGAFRRPVTFTDTLGFILGSVGDDGAIFATDIAEDDDDDEQDEDIVVQGLRMTSEILKKKKKNKLGIAGSTIYFHRFETIGSMRDKDWYLTLPDGERALGCATGEGWAAVMTSRRFLRLFSSGGNQGQLIWLEGDPVTMAGRGRFLGVFYHASTPLVDGTQKLGYILYDAVANRTVTKGSVSCIGSGGSLTWVGFGNDSSLLAMDSTGMLSMLVCKSADSSNPNNWEWVPILDTVGLRKSAEDSFWPITVTDGKMVCVPLKGGTKYPDATRRPVASAIGFRLPLARGTLANGNALEELSVRADIALSQKKVVHDVTFEGQVDEEFEEEFLALSAQVDKVTLKLFAATVEAGKLERALDLVDRLYLEKSYDLAMVIADNHRKLVSLIEEAKDSKFGEQETTTPEEEDYEDDEYQRITPDSHRKRAFEPDVREGMRQVRSRQGMA